jgi:hypothetical protein
MGKVWNIYLAAQPAPNKGTYEIYKEGKRTGEMLDPPGVQNLLSPTQYREFLNGDTIFYIPSDKFRKRNQKPKPKFYEGRSPSNFNFIL